MIRLLLLLVLIMPVAAQEPSLPALMARDYNGRDLTLKKVLASNSVYTRYLITYKSDDLTISGIMNRPKGAGPFPVLILNHGFIDPSIYTNGRGLKREQDYLARHGYIVIHPDYRNHAFSDKDPNDLAGFRLGYAIDAINCIMAVKNSDKPYFNKDKIGLLGHSMGGGVVLNVLVTKPELAQAAVLFAPVSADYRDNFTRWLWRRKHHPEVAEKIIAKYGSPESNPEFWAGLSAVNYLDRIKAPIMLNHGTADQSVPFDWSLRLEKELKDHGKSVVFYQYPGEHHEFGPQWPLLMQRTVKFFDQYLK
ncbi:MAG: alpha/beta fold hydrolase [Candidatus Margulisbacteria bacterium]|nr:alpha/beta fold hydrolase [Candidatus Margulisiibacteriota bacterium]